MPYKDLNSEKAKASQARAQAKYNQTKKGKEVRKKHHQNWTDKNQEYIIDYQAKYRNRPEYHKQNTIYHWKGRGLIETEEYSYDDLYEAYLQQGYCELCNNPFRDSTDRCMDHDHKTGLFRDFLCKSCNVKRG